MNATKSTHNITHHPTHHPASTLPHQEIEAAPHGKLIPFLHCGLRFPNNGDPPAGIGVSQDVHLFKGRGRGGGLSRVNLTVFSNNLDTFGETFWPTPISNINQSHKTPPNQNHMARSVYLDLNQGLKIGNLSFDCLYIIMCHSRSKSLHHQCNGCNSQNKQANNATITICLSVAAYQDILLHFYLLSVDNWNTSTLNKWWLSPK